MSAPSPLHASPLQSDASLAFSFEAMLNEYSLDMPSVDAPGTAFPDVPSEVLLETLPESSDVATDDDRAAQELEGASAVHVLAGERDDADWTMDEMTDMYSGCKQPAPYMATLRATHEGPLEVAEFVADFADNDKTRAVKQPSALRSVKNPPLQFIDLSDVSFESIPPAISTHHYGYSNCVAPYGPRVLDLKKLLDQNAMRKNERGLVDAKVVVTDEVRRIVQDRMDRIPATTSRLAAWNYLSAVTFVDDDDTIANDREHVVACLRALDEIPVPPSDTDMACDQWLLTTERFCVVIRSLDRRVADLVASLCGVFCIATTYHLEGLVKILQPVMPICHDTNRCMNAVRQHTISLTRRRKIHTQMYDDAVVMSRETIRLNRKLVLLTTSKKPKSPCSSPVAMHALRPAHPTLFQPCAKSAASAICTTSTAPSSSDFKNLNALYKWLDRKGRKRTHVYKHPS